MDLPGLEWGGWEAVGIVVRTQFDPSRADRPGFIVADVGVSPLDDRARIAKLIALAPAMAELLIEAGAFIETEADNRAAAGSACSDYEREPRDLAGRIQHALAQLGGR